MPRRYVKVRARRARATLGAWSAARQARSIARRRPAAVRVCWDLDNTLVGSGRLLRNGRQLHEAVVEAGPVPNMLSFFNAITRGLPTADHFILSARPTAMRADTLAWLDDHGLALSGGAICLVPDPMAKPTVWRQLARRGQLVIVDDLSYGHEYPEPESYGALVARATAIASAYVGLEDIARIERDARAVGVVLATVLERLANERRS